MAQHAGSMPARVAVGVLLVACTVGARLPAMRWPLWQDEVGAERVISRPTPRAALGQVARRESTPPAFYMSAWAAAHAVTAVSPSSRPVRVLRALPLAFSVATTIVTFVLAGELLPLWAAGLAGFLVSFGSELVVHGTELRAYPLLALASVLFAFTVGRAVSHPSRGRLAALAATVAVGTLTHYFFVLTLLGGTTWLAVSRFERAVLRRVTTALAVGLVPLAVWSPYLLRQYRHHVFETAPPFTLGRLAEVVPSLFVPQALVGETGRFVQAAALILVVGSAAFLLRERRGRLYALLVLVPLAGCGATGALGTRVFNNRNLIGIVPFAAIAVAWACASPRRWHVGRAMAAVSAVLVVAGFAYARAELGRTPYDRIGRTVDTLGVGRGEPLAWFGAYGGVIPVTWYATSDLPRHRWPRIVRVAAPLGPGCEGLVVVARNPAGRHWLRRHSDAVTAEISLPSYGDAPQARRDRADVIVARLDWGRGLLQDASAAHALLLQRSDATPTCTVPARSG